MKYIIIAIALSMDTFSLSLGLSLISNNNKINIFPITVGIFHFLFPIIGNILGTRLLKYVSISSNKLLGVIFLLLFIKLLKDIIFKKEVDIKINIINIIILSILVSIDSLITGIGLIINIKVSLIFSIISFLFTLIGLKLGNITKKELENTASYIGLFLLFILSIIHLCK